VQRLLERAVIGLLFASCIIFVWQIAGNWGFEDVDAYWDAASRIRQGQDLYPAGVDPDNYRVFRYAPWFAWLWVPLTDLPRPLVELAWGGILGVAALAILVGLARLRSAAGWALLLIITPWLLSLVQVGNIQPLVVAMLAFGVSRRSGPLWIAIAASLKAVPILWGLVYLARREWSRIGLAVLVAALLAASFLLYDTSGYVTDPGRSGFSLYYYVSPTAWAVGAVIAGAAAFFFAWRRSEWVWPAVAVAAMLIAPRSHITYATYLVIGLLNDPADRIRTRA
jgi:Glycosyltransferase family 87